MQNQERQERHFGRIFSSGAEFVKNAKSEVHRTGAQSRKGGNRFGVGRIWAFFTGVWRLETSYKRRR